MNPLYYDVWIENHASHYLEELVMKHSEGKVSLIQLDKYSTKLMEWEDHYIRQFGQKCKDKNYLNR